MKKPAVVALIVLAALCACRGGKPSNATSTQTAPAATGVTEKATPPSCNGESPVWVLADAKVFLVPGDRLYGKTKRGRYLCLSEAQAEGYRAGRRPFRRHRGNKLFSV